LPPILATDRHEWNTAHRRTLITISRCGPPREWHSPPPGPCSVIINAIYDCCYATLKGFAFLASTRRASFQQGIESAVCQTPKISQLWANNHGLRILLIAKSWCGQMIRVGKCNSAMAGACFPFGKDIAAMLALFGETRMYGNAFSWTFSVVIPTPCSSVGHKGLIISILSTRKRDIY
jgi:hypothetical protein